jgi:YihY family inner membrane protein
MWHFPETKVVSRCSWAKLTKHYHMKGTFHIPSFLKFCWRVISLAYTRFAAIEGEQRAGAFAYYALFSLFPLILLGVTVGSLVVEPGRAMHEIIRFVNLYLPLGEENQALLAETVRGVIEGRGGIGIVAFLGLAWSSSRFFYVLVRGVNRAWNTEPHNWWRLPLKNFLLLGIVTSALLFGMLAPTVVQSLRQWLPEQLGLFTKAISRLLVFVPMLILFYGFSMLYKLAPRRRTKFSEVWLPALAVTVMLRLLSVLFVFYVQSFGQFNALYGTFGAIMILLLWIYLSGAILIFGGCLCAAIAELRER